MKNAASWNIMALLRSQFWYIIAFCNYMSKLYNNLSNISADDHLDSVEDTISGHSGQPRIEVRKGR